MIGHNLRRILTVVAWLIIAFAPVLLVFAISEILAGDTEIVGIKWQFWLATAYGALLPGVHGGALLVLLSIDARLERKV